MFSLLLKELIYIFLFSHLLWLYSSVFVRLVRNTGDRVSLTVAHNVHAFGISGQEAAMPMPALPRKISNGEDGKPRIKRSGQEPAMPMPALPRKHSNREEGKARIKPFWCLPGMWCG